MSTLVQRRSVEDAINRMFEDSSPWPPTAHIREGLLPIDIAQPYKDIIVRASLPGFRKEDVEVQIENGVLSIKASRNEDETGNGVRYFLRERRMGSLSRCIVLPVKVQDEEISAELKDGVLTIWIPIAEETEPKQIVVL